MADTTMKKKGVVIGCRDVVFAAMTADESTGTTYEADLFHAPGVIEIALTAKGTSESIGADDVPIYDILESIDGYDISMTMAALGTDGCAYLLGHNIDSKGVMHEKSSDIAPYVAMGFKTACSDGTDDYIWLYKGKFKPSDATFRTKEDGKVNWQTPALTGTFAPRASDSEIKTIVNTGDTAAANILATFFTEPYETPSSTGGGM